ncbi:hypothetical protein DH2020_023721 [Rehmannia glutinosa]|uniref:HECT-type E3 ubiquitin transferase n=1 Tax=Rehmannia glutinosa TaxID=99300 RepID=A0ABR0W959_REHGL
METRSRKRAEASTSAALSGPTTRATKRARISTTSSAATATASANTPSISTRSRSVARSTSMDPNSEPSTASGSTTRSRRGKNPSINQNWDNNNNNDNTNADKGKEKEPEIRNREIERSLGLNIDSHDGDDDDNDSEGGGGYLHQNFSASSALQGLLRKLGAGLDELLPSSAMGSASSSHQSGRLKKILSGLRADGEEGKQVEALTQLCDMLSIGTEESLSTFSVDSFVPVLVGLLNHESNPDIMLFAARALTHLVDVLPSSCAAVVHYGAVSCFVARLLTIEYMDLAEQSLQALKKISQEHPTACLRAGALMAVLSYLDFFSTGVQRVALATAANMCKKLPSDAADFVMEAVPLLTNLLQYHDAKVRYSTAVLLCFRICIYLLDAIAEAFASSPEKLDELCNHGLVAQAASLISSSNSGGGQASLTTPTYTGLIRLLSTCASGSPLGAKSLLLLGISGILKDILQGSGLVSSMSVSPALNRPSEQIFEIVNLANELLPPLPQGTISLPASSSLFMKGSLPKKGNAGSSGKQEDSNGNTQEVLTREKLLNDQPELLQQFGTDLLPVLVQCEWSCTPQMSFSYRKLMYFSSSEMIQSLINVTNISSFLAGVLAWKDPQVLVPALQIAEILMEKLPGTFSKMFVREGVVHAVHTLILTGSTSSSQPPSNEKDNDSTPGSSRRRNRRRGGNSGSDANPDDSKNSIPSIVSQPNSVEIPTVNSSLRAAVSACAKTFKEKYFPSDPEAGETGATDDLLRLKNLCMKLNAGIDEQKSKLKGKSKASGPRPSDISASKEEHLVEVITEMLRELSREDGVSTFEFIGSGVVASLLNYFTCGYFSKEKISEVNLPKLRQQAIRRYRSFVSVALPSSVDEGTLVPMSLVVQKLQNALSSLERFPVMLSHASRSSGAGNARLSSGLREKSLRDYSSNVVLIDPLASLAAVEEFLWPRVQRRTGISSPSASTPASATRRHSTRSRSSINIGDTAKKESSLEKNPSSSKAKGKAVLKPNQEEGRGPQTRNAARRRAALDKDNEMKPVEGDTSSEDDELDISPVEIDEALVLGDDTLPICMPDKVHDVKLGDSVEDSLVPAASDGQNNPTCSSSSRGSAEFRSGSSFGSRGAMSFAAAAMAGLASGNNRGVRAGRDQRGPPLFGSKDSSRLIFTAGGRQLNRHLTIYQAIQRQLASDEDDDDRFAGSDLVSSDGSRLWTDIYTIMYQRADGQAERSALGNVSSITSSKSTKANSSSNSGSDTLAHRVSLLDSILQGELPCDLERSNPTYNILALLRVIEGLNQLAPRLRVQQMIDMFSEGKVSSLDELSTTGVKVPPEDFINGKLTPKLARQIQDALALCSGSLPSWCYQLTKACPFLFPFETRRQYFYSTAFGLSRALYRLQQQQGADGHGSAGDREVRVGRLQRQKVRVSRNRILDSAAKVMEMYSSQKAVLEVEYFGEVGTGLGPTLEFYTLLSHELQKDGLRMWRSSSSLGTPSMEIDVDGQVGDKDIIHVPLGLFPRPWPPNAETSDGSKFSKVIEYYRLLGRVMAKALQDGRLLDLPLSAAFYKLVLGQELDLHDIVSFDVELGTTLQELQALVDMSTLGDYVSLVVDATVGTGIMRQIEAFRSGFNQVFDIATLQIFSPNELDYLLCGRRELWKAESLADHIKFDHGYTSKSPAIVYLLEIMGEFTPEQQRAFCQFVTGAPRLPPGGLAVLNPKLTIVRKLSASTTSTANNGSGPSESADDDLPSVMTCANYLKLPPYSSKEIMYKKLLYAISEGQGSFDLS